MLRASPISAGEMYGLDRHHAITPRLFCLIQGLISPLHDTFKSVILQHLGKPKTGRHRMRYAFYFFGLHRHANTLGQQLRPSPIGFGQDDKKFFSANASPFRLMQLLMQ